MGIEAFTYTYIINNNIYYILLYFNTEYVNYGLRYILVRDVVRSERTIDI